MERYVVFGLVAALAIAGLLSTFASPEPDGLERVAEDNGFIEHGQENFIPPLFPDYSVPGVEESYSGSLAGIVGVALVFGAVVVLGYALSRKR